MPGGEGLKRWIDRLSRDIKSGQFNAGNPVAIIERTEQLTRDYLVYGNINTQLELPVGFALSGTLDFTILSEQEDIHNDAIDQGTSNSTRSSAIQSLSGFSRTLTPEAFLHYDVENDLHDISALLGASTTMYHGKSFAAFAEELPSGTKSIAAGSSKTVNGSVASARATSFLGQLQYSLLNRYLLTASINRDRSSEYNPDDRWSHFPAASVGWRLSEEAFMLDVDVISYAKIRAEYGLLGRTANTSMDYSLHSTRETGVVDPGLMPETVKAANMGLDLSLFKQRITLTADGFIRDSENMLSEVRIPSYAGMSGIDSSSNYRYQDVGSVRNVGLELVVDYIRNPQNEPDVLNLLMGGHVVFLKNQVVSLVSDTLFGNNTITQEGESMSMFYGYVADGIFQNQGEADAYTAVNGSGNVVKIQPNASAGDVKYKDLSGDGRITALDRTIIGNPWPLFTFGAKFGAAFKGLDFSTYWSGSVGNDIYAASRMSVTDPHLAGSSYANREKGVKEAYNWENDGDTPRIDNEDPNGNNRPSTRFIQDGSYVRLKTIRLSYQLPARILRGFNAAGATMSMYLQVNNLLTITRYDGLDPHVVGGGVSLGIDTNDYPSTRVFLVGVKVGI